MGEGIAHILSPAVAPWCGWTMLALLVCAALAEHMQPGVITQAHASLFAHSDRTYKDAPRNFYGQLFVALFRIGTLALALCVCLYTEGHCSFTGFAAVCGIVLAVLGLKMLCNIIVAYTFRLFHMAAIAYEHYANIATLAILLLYPTVLVLLRGGNPITARWALAIISVLFLGMWTYRSARLLIRSPKAILYLIFYISTLEVLPMGILYFVSEKTISVL